ncbi:hypothetical protein Flavo103_07680 [Flavobacterium collinsii]|jgi:hypothetical protein|uniref:hypothetical protein n=1 Tax=Flavobacterium collinsii TaxID=1114861 RepID=UPI0022C02271|nr:hypothetical protein [Flavobacterium collinsii]GIQ57632.1 hypothetical protein Flavo103_07680 [Flavobacterium collinsii]
MKTQIAGVLFLFFLLSCKEGKPILNKNKVDSEKVITMNQTSIAKDTLAAKIRKDGDKDAYDELFYSLMESTIDERTDSIMVYSKIMAEKYHYERAYFDYFQALCRKANISYDYGDYSSINLTKADSVTKRLGKEWLAKMVTDKLLTKQQYDSIKK